VVKRELSADREMPALIVLVRFRSTAPSCNQHISPGVFESNAVLDRIFLLGGSSRLKYFSERDSISILNGNNALGID